jgi:hypothetical protein
MDNGTWQGLKNDSKGFVFSLDAILAVSIMVIFIIASFMIMAKSSEDGYAKLQMVRLGKDLMAVLEKSGTLALWDRDRIENAIETHLPHGASYYVQMDKFMYANGTFIIVKSGQYGHEPQKSENVYATRRDFVTQNSSEMEYTIARLWVW